MLDINLPDIDGYEVCRRSKSSKTTEGVAVLQISATYADGHARVSALDCGADAYLNEPVAPGVLLAALNAGGRSYAPSQGRPPGPGRCRNFMIWRTVSSYGCHFAASAATPWTTAIFSAAAAAHDSR